MAIIGNHGDGFGGLHEEFLALGGWFWYVVVILSKNMYNKFNYISSLFL